jgi:gliding motility-associated-like protein
MKTIMKSIKGMYQNLSKAFVLITLLVTNLSFAQVTIDQTMTPEQLVQNVLLGAGITVSNVTFNGLPGNMLNNQIAKYNGPSSFIAFDEGIVMVSGPAEVVTGGFGGILNPNVVGDPDLWALANVGGTNFSVNNCAILEFDFVPTGDSLEVRYVFASMEYPSFTCSSFNDPFGFFLSGPGITGPFSNSAINIATIPGTNTPIGVNTVNSGVPSNFNSPANCLAANPNFVADSQYFVSNQPLQPGDVQFPGMTVTLTARGTVICGETYHIKLAIADASDGALDSGVFIEAGSFLSNEQILLVSQIEGGINDSTLVEGCGGGSLTFQRINTSVDQTLYITTEGTAINGVDYTAIPDSIFFPAGVEEITIFIEAFHDFLVEGVETIIINLENEAVCGGLVLQSSYTLYIDEYPVMTMNTQDGYVDCGIPINLIPVVQGGNPPYTYQWSSGQTTPSITVAPLTTTVYTITVTDSCGLYTLTNEIEVEVPVYDELSVDIGDDWTLTCITDMTIVPNVIGGSGDFVYQWFNNGVEVSDELIWSELADGDGTLMFTITDHCGNTDSDELNYITPEVEIYVELGPDYFASCVDLTSVTSVFSGGVGEYTFQWTMNGQPYSDLSSIVVQTNETVLLALQVTDQCGNTGADFVTLHIPNIPLELEVSVDTTICLGGTARLFAEALGGEAGFQYVWTPINRFTDEIFVSPGDTTTYQVVATDICGKAISGEVTVNVTWVESAFEIEYIGSNGVALTNLSTPDWEYLWNFGDNFSSRNFEPTHEYSIAGDYMISLYVEDTLGCNAWSYQIYNPPMFIYIPNSFTPNGDGINEIFKAKGDYVKSFEMVILNRQGEVLFESFDIDNGWDGSANKGSYFVPDGVYIFKYKAENYLGEKISDTGTVTILR